MPTPENDRPPLRGKDAAIAEVLFAADSSHVGMAIVIDARHVVTCAHVVNAALKLPMSDTPQPAGEVMLGFPLLENASTRNAVVAKGGWYAMSERIKASDVALLELVAREPDIPAQVGTATFADVVGRRTEGDALSVYGIAGGEQVGVHLAARFVGPARGTLVQVDSTEASGRLIRRGFSGAGVFDEREQTLTGMAQLRKTDPAAGAADQPKAAFMIPTAVLAKLVSSIPVERRGRPSWFDAVWNLCAVVFFLLSLAHLWVSQKGQGVIAELAFENRHPQLAAFFGMHVIAFLGPFVAWLLWRYARDFSRSPWSLRIPPFPFCSTRRFIGPRPLMSSIVVLAFVLFPIWSQGHFIKKFLGEGTVYSHVKTFGFENLRADLKAKGRCIKGDFCEHTGGRFQYETVIPPAAGGYFDHAYQYGEVRDDATSVAVTFFPVWQPIILFALSAIAFVLLVWWVRAVFPHPRQSFADWLARRRARKNVAAAA